VTERAAELARRWSRAMGLPPMLMMRWCGSCTDDDLPEGIRDLVYVQYHDV